MLSNVHLVDSFVTLVNDDTAPRGYKAYFIANFTGTLRQILDTNKDKEVYIYKPSLNTNAIRGFTIPVLKH